MYWSPRIESHPRLCHFVYWFVLFIWKVATAATKSIRPTGGKDSPHPQKNIQSQQNP